MKYLLSIIFALFLFSCGSDMKQDLPLRIAERYGIEAFEKLDYLDFTFKVKFNDKERARDWRWYPKADLVIQYSEMDTIEYKRTNISGTFEKTDQQFINDSYWLVFPFHLKWDKGGYDYEVKEKVKAPITDTLTTKLTIKYKFDQGYTPGDVYELYVNDDLRIIEWVFIEGGKGEGDVMVWENEQDFNGVLIPINHRTKDGSFKLWFDEVSVK